MSELEIPLVGGQINTVIRIGDTVRRATTRDMGLQHALFDHLYKKGFAGAPRFIGHGEQGREILSFLPGHVPVGEGDFTDVQLAAAARVLRAYHDATNDFPPVIEANAEILCHNDWTPANAVFAQGLPYGLIDFDTAAPGSRLWDFSYSVWTWLDFGDPGWDPAEQRRRMANIIAAYDHPSCTPALVAACLPARQAGRAAWAKKEGMDEAVTWANQCLDWTLAHITQFFHPDGLP